MKKILLLVSMLLAFMPLSACSPAHDNPAPEGHGRYLVIFSSRSGNTEKVAEEICRQLDCDILEVVPEVPYEDDYNKMLERAREELSAIRQGNYPETRTSADNFDDYEMIFVGYPIWYGSIATPMQSFLHLHSEKLSGKRVALFATSGSSGIASSVNEAISLCPDAEIMENSLLLTSSSLPQAERRVTEWLENIGVLGNMSENPSENPDVQSLQMKITAGDRSVTATMEDNSAARDLLSRLPMEITLTDYNNTTEKIFYPDPKLDTEGAASGCEPVPGDITIYAPWGNVAIFCKSWSYSNDLIRIGHIDDGGIELLSVPGDIPVRLEIASNNLKTNE